VLENLPVEVKEGALAWEFTICDLRFTSGTRSSEGLAGRAGGFGLVLAAERVEAVLQHATQGLLDQVPSNEGGSIDGAFLLAAATNFAGLGW
jgi:hypothetical protein